jgi:hypothetical protein
MIFSLDVRRARKGDCLILHCGTKAKPRLIMIDGGPKSVYKPHLRPRLLEIRQARGLGSHQPLLVDLLMVSHVDDDHIQGILDLTRELRDAGAQAPMIRVASLWHNSFDDVIGNDPQELTASVSGGFGPASLNGGLAPEASIDLGDKATDEDREVARSTLMVLASIEQGHRLRGDAGVLGWTPNAEFGGKLILAGKQPIDLGDGLEFTVAGPLAPELKALQKKHDEWLKTRNKAKSDEAALAAYVDKSVPNLSSIVVLAQQGGKRILLTGDARGDKILTGLESTGLVKKGGSLHVDILKVPHHGSSNNLDDDFFERVKADHYVFSGNGEHGNPERETLEMLFKARAKEPFEMHLTYPVSEIDPAREDDWNKEQAKEKKKKAEGGKKKPRANWSAAKHSLAAFFKGKKLAKGQKVRIVGEAGPHVIDLHEALGY